MPTFSCMEKGHWAKLLTGPLMILAWGIAVLIGMCGMVRYQMTPADLVQKTPHQWPSGVSIMRNKGRPTLVMTLHPKCPCSQASVYELAELMTRAAGRLDACVLFIQPENAPADWLDGDLWRQAKAIPGVTVLVDKDGHDAAAFGASTSGQVMVYDAEGAVQFSGGVTDGRGHEGDNAGMLAVLALVRDGKSPIPTTPVYGCSLGVCRINHK
jgi:hypothetical protein